jgi:acetyl esterase/lipase
MRHFHAIHFSCMQLMMIGMIGVFLLLGGVNMWAQIPVTLPGSFEAHRDLVYATVDGVPLKLDLYLPLNAAKPMPLVIFVHGGSWRVGTRGDSMALQMIPFGFAVADIEYRFSQQAVFPAQIHDCKAAVRWLRANAFKYGLNPDKIGAWGSSAGGHLVALLGTTAGNPELEGNEGNPKVSSRVEAACDFFGPTDFLDMDEQGIDEEGRKAIGDVAAKLIGGPILDNREKARQASPVFYVDARACPFLIVHGGSDRLVPVGQSKELDEALRKAGVESTLVVVPGADHGFLDADVIRRVGAFFRSHLAGP